MFGFIVAALGAIWDFLTGVAAASVTALWALVTTIASGLKATARVLSLFGQHAWGFLRATWDTVLGPIVDHTIKPVWDLLRRFWDSVIVPAWRKFNELVDRLHTWLTDKFAPILCWLRRAREAIDTVYKDVIRPILTLIDVARAFLKILEQFGVKWAKALDDYLSQLEQRIEQPFLWITAKINELVNWVNRIVDLDGLFQRIVLLRSLVRDAEAQLRILQNLRLRDLTTDDKKRAKDAQHGKRYEQMQRDVVDAIVTGGGADGPLTDEIAIEWKNNIRAALP